ncbi:TetR/AcrR family transcriptional regulator [Noviherbaspirillum suwonense]|uniref:Transcriptional regulator, TetR family n=1 Tax=Noviherbaspirillum suwonense TaxID=1224511 RepID=A0ABY1QU18_9BURK|nr:TetR/AcrR family transcriptional regulator [Noviherbaspirillum suwonense]SMP79090.1 transcriptional regulator, TetR family [Noviherbaspirillum suwonense]
MRRRARNALLHAINSRDQEFKSIKRLLVYGTVYTMTKAADNLISQLSRRDAILAAAASLFRRQGFERTSVREIAQVLGMTSGSLFYHFASKEDLLVAIMEEGLRDITRSVREALAAEDRLAERLLSMIRRHLGALLGPRLDAMTVLLYEWRSLAPTAQARVMASRDDYEALWIPPINEAALEGLVDADIVLVRQTVLGALNWTAQWYRPTGRLGIDALAQRMYTVLFPRVAALEAGHVALEEAKLGGVQKWNTGTESR